MYMPDNSFHMGKVVSSGALGRHIEKGIFLCSTRFGILNSRGATWTPVVLKWALDCDMWFLFLVLLWSMQDGPPRSGYVTTTSLDLVCSWGPWAQIQQFWQDKDCVRSDGQAQVDIRKGDIAVRAHVVMSCFTWNASQVWGQLGATVWCSFIRLHCHWFDLRNQCVRNRVESPQRV